MASEVTGIIRKIKRISISENGNPRYEIELDTGEVYRTKKDGQVGYKVWTGMEGVPVRMVFDGRGMVIDVEEQR